MTIRKRYLTTFFALWVSAWVAGNILIGFHFIEEFPLGYLATLFFFPGGAFIWLSEITESMSGVIVGYVLMLSLLISAVWVTTKRRMITVCALNVILVVSNIIGFVPFMPKILQEMYR